MLAFIHFIYSIINCNVYFLIYIEVVRTASDINLRYIQWNPPNSDRVLWPLQRGRFLLRGFHYSWHTPLAYNCPNHSLYPRDPEAPDAHLLPERILLTIYMVDESSILAFRKHFSGFTLPVTSLRVSHSSTTSQHIQLVWLSHDPLPTTALGVLHHQHADGRKGLVSLHTAFRCIPQECED